MRTFLHTYAGYQDFLYRPICPCHIPIPVGHGHVHLFISHLDSFSTYISPVDLSFLANHLNALRTLCEIIEKIAAEDFKKLNRNQGLAITSQIKN